MDNRLLDIHVDEGDEIFYNYDQAYNSFPCVFPTVNLSIWGYGLTEIANEIRGNDGLEPLGTDGAADGWYNFDVFLNGYSETHIGNCITFVVASDFMEDDGYEYEIPLTKEEQIVVYAILNADCERMLGKGCEELLEEAAQDNEEDAGGKLTILERRI